MNNLEIEYCVGKSCKKDISQHLYECDDFFVPLLSSRVNLDEFAEKIFSSCTTFEAWHCNDLVGLVSCYFNNERFVFINHVSVCKSFQRKGIINTLLKDCIQQSKKRDFYFLRLEVHDHNKIAKKIYKNYGFQLVSRKKDLLLFELNMGI
jgi:GNAT superfamily N-acetyltransferase